MSYSCTLYYETLSNNEKNTLLLALLESNVTPNKKTTEVSKALEALKSKLLQTSDYVKFDAYVARTFGFGIPSLINPVLNFLSTSKVSATPQEVALLVLGVVFSLVPELKDLQESVRELIKSKKLKKVYEVFLKLLKFGKSAVTKFLEYLAYTSLAIPGATATLKLLSSEVPDFEQLLKGVGLSVVAHGVRALLTKKK